jgi:nucleotide-binding universal stress UspA family protein
VGISATPTWLATEGKTAHSIMTAMRQRDAELVVIGSHGYGRFDRLLGSTSTKLVRHAHVNILVIRKD